MQTPTSAMLITVFSFSSIGAITILVGLLGVGMAVKGHDSIKSSLQISETGITGLFDVPGLNTWLGNLLDSSPFTGATNRQTLSGNLTLSSGDARFQNIDPGGAGRDVNLPAESDGLAFVIGNRADAAEALTVKDDSGTTIATVNQDEVGYFLSDGTGWMGFASAGSVT